MVEAKQLRQRISEAIDQRRPDLNALNAFIHKNPELGHREHEASVRVCGVLADEGFVVTRGVAGLETAFTAVFRAKRPGPTVAFVAEYDALPELGHACGHNLISVSSVGAAIGLAKVIEDIGGAVEVIGTPSEEGPPQGKVTMVDRGVFDEVDVVLMMHGSDRTSVGGGNLALQTIEMTFHGKAAHAAKFPWEGVSALDAALLTAHAIELHREHVLPDVRIHGIITDGGQAPNIVPERAAMRYYVRGLTTETVASVVRKVENSARGCAAAIGASVDFNAHPRIDSKILIPTLDRLLLENAREAGADRILPPEEALGSTDFGNVSQRVPAASLKTEVSPLGVGVHTKLFADAAGGPAGERAIIIAAKTLAWTGLQLMTDSGVLDMVKAEFKERRQRLAPQ